MFERVESVFRVLAIYYFSFFVVGLLMFYFNFMRFFFVFTFIVVYKYCRFWFRYFFNIIYVTKHLGFLQRFLI